MTYNMTALQNVSSVVDLVVYANTSASSLLMPLFLMAVFIVMLMALLRYGFDNALMVSSWLCFMLSMFFGFAGLLPLVWTLGFLVIAAFMTFYSFVFQ